jgi:hypothetical protein
MKLDYEKELEARLGQRVKELGCKYLKLQVRNYPDRMILLEPGMCFFVECKREGERLRPAQADCCWRLEQLGFLVFLCDSDEVIEEIVGKINEVRTYYASIQPTQLSN